mgnify:CR=1 FL=1
MERYLLYEEDGEYKRYVAGTFCGQEVPCIYFGTLYDSGTYTLDNSTSPASILFGPKKQYVRGFEGHVRKF